MKKHGTKRKAEYVSIEDTATILSSASPSYYYTCNRLTGKEPFCTAHTSKPASEDYYTSESECVASCKRTQLPTVLSQQLQTYLSPSDRILLAQTSRAKQQEYAKQAEPATLVHRKQQIAVILQWVRDFFRRKNDLEFQMHDFDYDDNEGDFGTTFEIGPSNMTIRIDQWDNTYEYEPRFIWTGTWGGTGVHLQFVEEEDYQQQQTKNLVQMVRYLLDSHTKRIEAHLFVEFDIPLDQFSPSQLEILDEIAIPFEDTDTFVIKINGSQVEFSQLNHFLLKPDKAQFTWLIASI